MLVEKLYDHCDSGMYTLNYQPPDHMVEPAKRFEHYLHQIAGYTSISKVYIKQAFRDALQKRHKRIIETVQVIKGNYDRPSPYRKEDTIVSL